MACTACGSILNGIYKHAPMTMEQLNESRNRDREIVLLTDSEMSLFGTTTPPSVEYILDALHDDPVTEPLRFIPAFEMTTNSSDEDMRYLVTWEALYAIQHSLGLRYLVDGGIEDDGDDVNRIGSLRSFDGTAFANRGDIDRGSITTIGQEGLFSVSLGLNSTVTGDYSTIAGGGAPASAGAGNDSRTTKGNIITSLGSFIGAGDNNAIIRINSTYIASKSFIAAGGGNTIYGSDFGFVHGTNNTINYVNINTNTDLDPSRGSHHSTIINGDANYIDARGFNTILGGTQNRIEKLYQSQGTGSVEDWVQGTGSVEDWVNGHNTILNGSGNQIYRGFGVINSGSSNIVQNSAHTSILGGTGNRTNNARFSFMIGSSSSQIMGGSPTSDFYAYNFENASIYMSRESAIIGSWLQESQISNTMNMLMGTERSAILNSVNTSIYNSSGSRIYGAQRANIIGSSDSRIIAVEPTNRFGNVTVTKVGTTVTFTTGTHGVTIGQTRYLLVSNYDGYDYNPDTGSYSNGSVNGMWRVIASTSTQFTATLTSSASAEFILNSPVKAVELYTDPAIHVNEIQSALILNTVNSKIENSRLSSLISTGGGNDENTPAYIRNSSSSNIAFSIKNGSGAYLYINSSYGCSVVSTTDSYINNSIDSNIIAGGLSYITNVTGRGAIIATDRSGIDSSNGSSIFGSTSSYILSSSYASTIFASGYTTITGSSDSSIVSSHASNMSQSIDIINSYQSHIFASSIGYGNIHYIRIENSNNSVILNAREYSYVENTSTYTTGYIGSYIYNSHKSFLQKVDGSYITGGQGNAVTNSTVSYISNSTDSGIDNSFGSYIFDSTRSFISESTSVGFISSPPNVIYYPDVRIVSSFNASIAFADYDSLISTSSKSKIFGGTNSTITNSNTSSIISSFSSSVAYADRSSIASSTGSHLYGAYVTESGGYNGILQCNVGFASGSDITSGTLNGYIKKAQLSNIIGGSNQHIISSMESSIVVSSGCNLRYGQLNTIMSSTNSHIGYDYTDNFVGYVEQSSIISSSSCKIYNDGNLRIMNSHVISSSSSDVKNSSFSGVIFSTNSIIGDSFVTSNHNLNLVENNSIIGSNYSTINASTHMTIVGGEVNYIGSNSESARYSNSNSGIFVGSHNYIYDSDSSTVIGSINGYINWSATSSIIASVGPDENCSIEYSEGSAILASSRSHIRSFNNTTDDYPTAYWSQATGTFTSGDIVTNQLTITHNLGRNVDGWKLFAELTTSDGAVRVVPASNITDPTGLGNVMVISNMNIYGAITGTWTWKVVSGGSVFGNWQYPQYGSVRDIYVADNATITSVICGSNNSNIENSADTSIISTNAGTITNSLLSVMFGATNSCTIDDSTAVGIILSNQSAIMSSSESGIMFSSQSYIRNVMDASILSSNGAYIVSDSLISIQYMNHDVMISASHNVGIGTVRTSGVGSSAIIASAGSLDYDSNYGDAFTDVTPTTLISNYVENATISSSYSSYIKTRIDTSNISSSSYSYIDGGASTAGRTNSNLEIASSSSSYIRCVGLSSSSIHSSVNSYIDCANPDPTLDRTQLTIFGSYESFISGNVFDTGMCSIANSSYSFIQGAQRSFLIGVNGINPSYRASIVESYSAYMIGSDDVSMYRGENSGILGCLKSSISYTHFGHIVAANNSSIYDSSFSSVLGSDTSSIASSGKSTIAGANNSSIYEGLRNAIYGTTGASIAGGYNNVIIGGEGNNYGALGTMAAIRPTDAIGDVETTGDVAATLVNITRSTSYTFTTGDFTFGSVTTIDIGAHVCQVGDKIEFLGSNYNGLYDNVPYVIKAVVGNIVTIGVDLTIYAQASNAIIGGERNIMISGRHNIIGGGSLNEMSNSVVKAATTSYTVVGTTLTVSLNPSYALTEGYSAFNFPTVTLYTVERRSVDTTVIAGADDLVDFNPLFSVPATSNSTTSITLDLTSVTAQFPNGTVISGGEIILSLGFDAYTVAHTYENIIFGGYANSTMWDSRRSGVLAGSFNRVYGTDSCLVLGGRHNQVSYMNGYTKFLAEGSSVLGGQDNTILNAKYSSIIAGYSNTLGIATFMSAIVGGANNTIRAASNVADPASTFYVGGGINISTQSSEFIGGGVENTILFSDSGKIHNAIVGGRDNQIANSEDSGIFTSHGSNIGVDSASLNARRCAIIGGQNEVIGSTGSDVNGCIIISAGSGNSINSGSQNIIIGSGNSISGASGSNVIGAGNTVTASGCNVIGTNLTVSASFTGIVTNAIDLANASSQLKVGGYTYTFPTTTPTVGDKLRVAAGSSGTNIILEWGV